MLIFQIVLSLQKGKQTDKTLLSTIGFEQYLKKTSRRDQA